MRVRGSARTHIAARESRKKCLVKRARRFHYFYTCVVIAKSGRELATRKKNPILHMYACLNIVPL